MRSYRGREMKIGLVCDLMVNLSAGFIEKEFIFKRIRREN